MTFPAVARIPRVPRTFDSFARFTVGAALAAFGVAAVGGVPTEPLTHPAFWLFAVLCLAGELLPIRLARATHHDQITVSTAFAFAVLLTFGLLPAMAVYGAASLLADARDRRPPLKALFNASQYVLALAGAGVVLIAADQAADGSYTPAELPMILVAAVVFFVANHVFAGVAAALLTGRPLREHVTSDLGFHAWAAGFQLALAPVVVAAAQTQLVLVPLLFIPTLGIYFGGRHAIVNLYRALHDELTDLPNRHLLYQRLETALASARAGQCELVVMIVDLDEFKAVNDSLGHQLGDTLLCKAAERLQAVLPAEATLARLGGDEFAVVLPDADSEQTRELAELMLNHLQEPIEIDAFSLEIRASVGISRFSAGSDTAERLLKHADLALYRAKRESCAVEYHEDSDDDQGFDRVALASQLRRGIERDELVLHYQPKMAVRGGRHSVEALVRWRHPYLGLIHPEGFIPLAEQTNLIKPLTAWVLDAALGQCRQWRNRGLDVPVAVNLSTRSLLDRRLPEQIDALLAKWQLPASALQLEITETKIIADFGCARDVLEALRSAGVRVAIDDFGTGYSSLAQLQQLPADEIKIDKRFVRNMEHDENDAAIVRSTIGLGQNLALDITAEGVETQEVFDRLEGMGCDFLQGYHLSRPVPADACERELRDWIARENVKEASWRAAA